MLDLLLANIKILRTLVANRILQFVRSELGEFRSDPRWLFQEECMSQGGIEGEERDLADNVILRKREFDLGANVNKTELISHGSARSHDQYGAASGGHGGCCPPVVDQYTWLALITGIALTTYFLRVAVTTNIMGRRRRKREGVDSFLLIGVY